MNPIISPLYIYLIYLCTPIIIFSIFVAIACVACLIVFATEDKLSNSKLIKHIFITMLIASLTSIVVPSSKTATKMLIASQITTDRVDKGIDIVEKVYTDIIKVMSDNK